MVSELPGLGFVTNMRVVTVVVVLGLMFSQDAGGSRIELLGPGVFRGTYELRPELSSRTPKTGGKLLR